MKEGNKGVAKTTEHSVCSIAPRQAQAWRGKSARRASKKHGQSAEILRLDDFRPVPPQPSPDSLAELADLHAKITGMSDGYRKQSEACRAFRSQIAELRAEINDLGTNMDLYRTKLDRIDTGPIRRKALRLAQLMDPWTRQ